ncbi:related to Conidial Pigment Biosynthesis protein brown1 [Cephalotrichum gorgonifer]|uniref:Related to Conidial Pigment Biosynthesis protein brown1 n=1 Tax=Cephalotrichum gorgonifer TaxID=2041049 RepID=A0AAE8MRK3_9PEZI|nr:related to Conidial Pigment Biosynthesis protein brown1 [Cephalotrichum gorgonifer]
MLPSSLTALIAGALAAVASAKVVKYNWDVTWVNAAPDGFSRPVIGVNNQWPCPEIRATEGDTIRVKMNNKLGNQTASIHFHGINQISTNWMDGPSFATQCPVPPGESITYEFVADTAGTYWWHSHNMGQYPDGFRGPLIVEDRRDPNRGSYDEERILTISDWHHEQSLKLGKAFLNPGNPLGIPPRADSILLNDGRGADYDFKAGKKYRFRIINMSASASAMIDFDSLDMEVIMNDAAHVKKQKVDQLRITPAQRYDVVVKAKGNRREKRNFGFLVSLDTNRDHTQPGARWQLNQTGYLVMDPSKEKKPVVVDAWNPVDDSKFKPRNNAKILPAPDKTLVFTFEHCADEHGILRHCVNGSPFVNPKVPTLYTAATTGEHNTNETVYGPVHPFIVSSGDIVDIVVNNHDVGVHPFHLHGHHFQVLTRPFTGAGDWSGSSDELNKRPPRRDTVSVYGNSHAVLRFEADNPGVYLFHCHIEWHVEMGLSATIIEAPDVLRDIAIPNDHINACKKAGIPFEGNAAGNVDEPLDTTGIEYDPPLEYTGAEWIPTLIPRFRRSRVARLA